MPLHKDQELSALGKLELSPPLGVFLFRKTEVVCSVWSYPLDTGRDVVYEVITAAGLTLGDDVIVPRSAVRNFGLNQ